MKELSKPGNIERGTRETVRFDKKVRDFAHGIVRVDKDEFVQHFDYGPPMDRGKGSGAAEALILYNSPMALPSDEKKAHAARYENGSGLEMMGVDEATENCDTLNVVTTGNPKHTNQCLAIVGNYESYHVQRWMRLPEKGPIDKDVPLRAVGRGYDKEGHNTLIPPTEEKVAAHWEMLKNYFNNLDGVMKRLKPIAESIAVDNTIIVMTCNMGQSELLINFVCNARAKDIPIDNVLVFPTDLETKDIAEGLGLKTFYDEKVSLILIASTFMRSTKLTYVFSKRLMKIHQILKPKTTETRHLLQ
jgi:hypothetical protein